MAVKTEQKALPLGTVDSDVLLARAQVFNELAQIHRETAAKCDNAELPAEYGDYERGKADAYDVCSETLKHIAKRANVSDERPERITPGAHDNQQP